MARSSIIAPREQFIYVAKPNFDGSIDYPIIAGYRIRKGRDTLADGDHSFHWEGGKYHDV